MASSQASSSSSSSSSSGPSQEYVVRVPKDAKKRHSILKFHHNLKIDLTKSGQLKMERENNLKDYKLSNDLDMQPKFGAGSEFGREQREVARKKKYGIYLKQYNPDDQPWLMKLGEGKQAKKFKGVKEGGISDNVSYFVFTQCPDGAFEACPVDDWYHFTPQIKHKVLSSEEAEEEFTRRDKTLNYFSIMVKKRLKNEDDDDGEDEKEKKTTKKKGKKKGFLLTDMDDWQGMSEDEEDGSDMDGENDSEKPKKKKDKKGKGKSKKFTKTNSDDEALEESDSLDEGQEVDYMTDSESNDEDMYKEKTGDTEEDKYKEQGVEDEDGLKKLMDSDEEEEEEEKKEEEEEAEDEEGKESKEKEKKDSDSDSSASSDSDSDPEKDVNFSSALFMQQKKIEKKRLAEAEKNRSRSATPTEEKVKKRKAETESNAAKKPKLEPTLSPSSSTASLASEGISEEAVRRYLMRKPMTTKDLVQKFKNTGLSKEQLVNTIAKILKRLDPEKTKIKDKLYLSIKKPE